MQRKTSTIDLAYEILKKENQPLPFQDIADQISDIKPRHEDYKEHVARLYTNMNLDGRFISIGEVHWALRSWYPFDQKEADIELPDLDHDPKKDWSEDPEDADDPIVKENDEDEAVEDNFDDESDL